MRHLEKGRVVIFAAGTGNPFFTTDTAAALRALEIGAEAILMAKSGIQGVYDGDPKEDANATFLPALTHLEAIERGLRVMDTTALSLCMENALPIHVFELAAGNILRVATGEQVGTVISTPSHSQRKGALMPTIEEFLDDAKRRMDKSIETTRTEFNSVRTGRASAALLDRISIDYYGTPTPLKNMATIGVPEPRMITVQPFDPSQIKAIEKAVQESDLGLTPSNDGKLIRLPIPQLTEERRKELVKLVRKYGEEGKIAIRNVRRDVMKHLEELVRNGEVGDDEELRGEKQVQKLTDEHTKAIDDLMKHKEAEDHGGLRSPPTSNRPTSPAASRSSWTATAAGPSAADSRWRTATARARARCGGRSRRRSTSACARSPSTPSRPRTGRVRPTRSSR